MKMDKKDKFIEKLEKDKMDFDFNAIHEYADEHFENKLSLRENIKNFKEWVS